MREDETRNFLLQTIGTDAFDMLQRSVALICIYDQDEVIQFTNEAFRNAYFVQPDERIDWQTLMRRNYAARRGTVIETADIEAWISSVRSRRGKSRQRTYESDLHCGRYIWVTETMREDGWIVYVGTDVTTLNISDRQLRLTNDKLLRQSCTDELTGVSNRRHILSKLQEVLDAGQNAWVCLADVDHFKRINDTYGHQTGDDVLVKIAQTARKTIKLQDSFGRVGGEEFMFLFADQPVEEVKLTLRRFRDVIGRLDCDGSHSELKITISGGLTYVSPTDALEQIYRRADLGLYSAKQNGRDRVYVCNPDESVDHFEITPPASSACGTTYGRKLEYSSR